MILADMKIIVTGAASGMGTYFARQLVAAGAQVVAGDVDEGGSKASAPLVKICPVPCILALST